MIDSLGQKLNYLASKLRKRIFSPSGTWGGKCLVQERKSEEESAEADRWSQSREERAGSPIHYLEGRISAGIED